MVGNLETFGFAALAGGGGGALIPANGFGAAPGGTYGEIRPTVEQIPELARVLMASHDPSQLLDVTSQFRKLLSIGALRARARLKRFSLNTNRSTPASPLPHTPTPRPRRAGPAD